MIAVLDQYTKTLILGYYQLGDSTTVTSFFNITRHHNAGAAFSLLADAGGWQRWFFLTLGTVISGGLLVWLYRLKPAEKWLALALALILGGALGNMIDRVWLGQVIDFIQLYYERWYWPAFNIADSAISVGAVLLVLDSLRSKQPDSVQNPTDQP